MGKVLFCWSGFPQYAARLVGAFVNAHPDQEVRVVATRPCVPVQGMENLCRCPIEWLESADQRSSALDWVDANTHAFINGWFIRPFMAVRKATRKGGGRVFCLIDNNYIAPGTLTLKERVVAFMKNLRFRCYLRWLFDGFMVPGESGLKLLKSWGVRRDLVSTGMYSADGTVFHDGKSLIERAKRIVYVGQFCARKNVVRLIEAFKRINRNSREGWELHLFGCGPIELKSEAGVVVHPFAQPEALAEEYRQARVFCLPSVEEHWGLVVHEGALSGCALALSSCIGAADDFVGDKNGVLFDPYSVEDMSQKLEKAMLMDETALRAAHDESISLACAVGLNRFVEGVEERLMHE